MFTKLVFHQNSEVVRQNFCLKHVSHLHAFALQRKAAHIMGKRAGSELDSLISIPALPLPGLTSDKVAYLCFSSPFCKMGINRILHIIPGKCSINAGHCGYFNPLKYFSQIKILIVTSFGI